MPRRHAIAFLARGLFRVVTFAAATAALFIIADNAYEDSRRWGLFVGLLCLYLAVAYLILPVIVHTIVRVTKRGRIPGRVFSTDGLPADPVNIVLVGTANDLRAAFKAAGWIEAQRLTLGTAIHVALAFVLKRPYPDAPFSTLVLFARRQDFGFQQAIGDSPRQRNHVRFWAAPRNLIPRLSDFAFWTSAAPSDPDERCSWVGAGSEDLGFGLTRATFQVTHRIDKSVDAERDLIVSALRSTGGIADVSYLEPGTTLSGGYVSDGRVAYATLVAAGAPAIAASATQ